MSSKLLAVAAAATAAPLTLALGIGLGSASSSTGNAAADPACLGTTGSGTDIGGGTKLNDTQAKNAQLIYQISVQMKLPSRAAVIAIATAMQESSLTNQKTATDLDSLGLFQQRPSQGWAPPHRSPTPTTPPRPSTSG